MSLPVNGFLQPVEIVVASTLPRNGYIQPVEVVAGVGVVTGSGAAGQVAYWDGATSITGNAGMTYVAGSNALTVTGFLNVGTTTDAVAAGDFAAGVTRKLFWDESLGFLQLTSTVAKQLRLAYTNGSVYADATVSSVGDLTFTATGSDFTFTGTSGSSSLAIFDNTSATVGRGGELLLQHTNGSAATTSYASVKGSAVSGGAGTENGDLLFKTMRVGALTIGATLKAAGAFQIGTATDASAVGDFSSGLSGAAGRIFYDQSVPSLALTGSSGNIGINLNLATGGFTRFNDEGLDIDFRVASDTNTHAFFVDGGLNSVSLLTSTATSASITFGGGLISSGNFRFAHGTSALATTATEGYMFMQSCAGDPTGVPASIPTGQKAWQYNSTAKTLWLYDGAWVKAKVAGVDVVFA